MFQIRDSRSRQLHENLADQCAESTDAATPAHLRASLFAGRPTGVVRDQAVIVLRAAAEAHDYRALNRSLMFVSELSQRDYVIDADTMAKVMRYVAPERTVEHVVQGRSLRIKPPAALEVAAGLAADNSHESAESIMRAVGGLQGLTADLRRSYAQRHEWAQSVADWAEAVWHRSGLDRVLDELDHLLPFPGPIEEANTTGTRDGGGRSASPSDGSANLSTIAEDPVSDPAHVSASGDPASDPAGDASEDPPGRPVRNPMGASDQGAAGDAAGNPADAGDEDAAQPVDGSEETSDSVGGAGSTALTIDNDGWKDDREVREARDARTAALSARNAVHARCYDLATGVRDGEALSRLAERITAESSPDWRARMHVITARTAQQDGDPTEVLRQAQLLLSIESPVDPASSGSGQAAPAAQQSNEDASDPAGPVVEALAVTAVDHSNPTASGPAAPDADDGEVDEEEATSSRRRLSLNLRVSAANTLALSGQAQTEEFRDLLPPETKPAWPNVVGSSDGLDSYKTMLFVLRMRELHHLIGIYDTLPEGGLEVPASASDPARTRFVSVMTVVAHLEAQAIAASMGLAEPPPTCQDLQTPSSACWNCRIPRQETGPAGTGSLKPESN